MANNIELEYEVTEALRTGYKIKAIKKLLSDNPRDLCLFTIGINTNLRASDLLSIKVHQVKDLTPGDEIALNEKKTKKPRRITLNKACISAIQGLLASEEYKDEDYLCIESVHGLCQWWIPLRYGIVSLRPHRCCWHD